MARRLGLALVLLPALALLIIVLVFALAQTATGKRLLAERIGGLLSSPESRVELAGLEGLVPFDMRLQRISVADPEGVWLEAAGARLSWSGPALLRARIEVEDLGVREVDLRRLPSSPEQEEPQELPRLPELPGWLPPVTVERLAVERLNLGEPVLGEAASFAIEGFLTTLDGGGAAVVDLDARRLDEATATASVQARLGLEPASLDLSVAAEETGGLLALLTGRPAAGDLEIWLSGAGPLEAWQGQLTVEAAGLLRADATIALEQLARFRIAGRVEPAQGLLPADLAPLAGERINLALVGARPAPQRLEFEQILVSAAAAELQARGWVDLDRQRLDFRTDLAAADLSAFSSLAGQPLAGSLELTVNAEGALMRPAGRIVLDARKLGFANVSARSATADLDYTVLEPLDSPQLAARVNGQGQVERLTLPAGSPLPLRDVDWRLGVLARANGPTELEELAVESDPLRLTGEGTIDPRTLAGTLALALEANELAPLTEAYGQRIEGRLRLDATTSIAEQAERVEIQLTGALEDLAGLPDAVAPLLGASPELSATARLEPDRRLEVTSLEVTGEEAKLDGQLAMSLPDQALDGRITLRLPRLAAIAPALGQDLAGAIEATSTVGGSAQAPEVVLHAGGQDLVLSGQEVQRLVLDATGDKLLAAPEGWLELTAAVAGIEAALSTGYRLDGDRLQLSDLRFSGPRSRLVGQAAIDLSGPLIDGRLEGALEDLAAWQPFVPVPLGGRVDVEARLQPESGRQTAQLTVDLGDLDSPFGRARQIGLQASVQDALGSPTLDARLTAADLRRDDLTVASARLGAQGTMEALSLSAAAEGTAVEEFDLAAEARLRLGDAVTLRLERLDGQVAGKSLRLAQTAELSLAGNDLRLTGLDLRLGRAVLRGDLALRPQGVEGEVRLARLPLGLLGRFGAPDLNGSADATLRISGTSDNPRAELWLELAEVRLADPDLAELPPLRLTADATLADRRLNGTLRGEGASDEPLTASFDLPLVVKLRPAPVELPQEGGISGRLDGELQIGRFANLLLDDQALDGLLTAALTVDGTVAEPQVGGSLRLTDGSYANGTTGTVLRDLRVVAAASSSRIIIRQLSATDGGNGRIEGQGEIGFEDGAQGDVRLQMRNAHLVRRDDADAILSGDLRLQGTAQRARLAGQVKIERAEVRIPDSVGPNVATIEVEEIGPDGEVQPPPEPGAEPFALRLDVDVALPGQVYVRGRGLESEWQGELQVAGTASEPRVTGELSVRRGFFDFIDRRFQLAESAIEFTGATPPDPSLDIEATAEADDMTAIVRVTGPASAPEFAFESEPPLPRDEVLSRLLFNRPISEIGPVQAAQLAFAVNRLRGGGGLDVLGELRKGLGVDTLDVVTGDTPEDGASVRAGKYLSDDVYLELERGMGPQSGRARVEVEILPNLSVEADTGEDARTGIGLKWKYDY